MIRKTLATVLGLVLLYGLTSLAPAAAAPDVTQWRYARRISDGPPGATVVELDGQALAAARADLADLRVVDANKRELPWYELIPASRSVARYPVRIIDVITDTTQGRSSFVADLGQAGRITNQITLSTTSLDFFKQLTFEVSNDLKSWQALGGTPAYVYDLTSSGGGKQLAAGYSETSYRYLRVTVADLGTAPLASLSAELRRYVPAARDEQPVPVSVLAQGIDADGAWTVLDLLGDGIAPTRLRVSTEAAAFRRSAFVEGSADRVRWVPVARSTLFRTSEGEQLDVHLPPPAATFRYYRVTVRTGDDTPLLPELITVYAVPRRVIFERSGSDQLYLLYGNPAATAPRYDREPLQLLNPTAVATSSLGRQLSVMTEPETVTPPVPPPKTDANSRYWRFERPLTAPASGFVQIALDGSVHDGARPDLADLRLVDDADSAVPYLMTRAGVACPLTFTIANTGGSGQTVWWVLDLGARNTPSHLVRIDADGTNFSRTVSVDGSNDGDAWTTVARGTIRRAETIFGREDNLVLSYPEARFRYLRVTGESGSVEFTPAEVRGFRTAILFMAESGRQYRLFYGNPDAPAVTYPPALFVDAYSPAVTGPDALGRETDHRPPAKLPWFLKPGADAGITGPANRVLGLALWGLLLVLVIGLALLTVRVFRNLMRQQWKG